MVNVSLLWSVDIIFFEVPISFDILLGLYVCTYLFSIGIVVTIDNGKFPLSDAERNSLSVFSLQVSYQILQSI